MGKEKLYSIKMLNGLVIKDITPEQILNGISTGKYLPSDFVSDEKDTWTHLKDTDFFKVNKKMFNGWMALFLMSFILNIIMLFMLFWQNSRIEQLLK